jgi:hypothetical protein
VGCAGVCVGGWGWQRADFQTVEIEKQRKLTEIRDNNPTSILEEIDNIEQRLLQISADQVYYSSLRTRVLLLSQSPSSLLQSLLSCAWISDPPPASFPLFLLPFSCGPPEIRAPEVGPAVRNFSDPNIHIARFRLTHSTVWCWLSQSKENRSKVVVILEALASAEKLLAVTVPSPVAPAPEPDVVIYGTTICSLTLPLLRISSLPTSFERTQSLPPRAWTGALPSPRH